MYHRSTSFNGILLFAGLSLWLGGCGSGDNTQPPISNNNNQVQNLTVGIQGSGRVTSDPAGIDCGSSCSESVTTGNSITLNATPASGFMFRDWSGDCSGSALSCDLAMTTHHAVVATFTTIQEPPPVQSTLTVSKNGVGTVMSTSGVINCGSICSSTMPITIPATDVILSATAGNGYNFTGWRGPGISCAGVGPCPVSMSVNHDVVAVFMSANATNYFNWDAESNDTSNGTVNGYFGGTLLDCSVRHSGLCSMKMDVVGPDSGNQSKGADLNQLSLPILSVGGSSIYYRTWLRYSTGFNWGVPQVADVKTERALLNSTQSRFMTGHMRSDGFYIAECEYVSGYGGGCLTTNGLPNNDYNIRIPYDVQGKADGQWHEYIIRIKPNISTTTSDAEFQVWVDGVSVGLLTGWKLTNSAADWIEAWGGWMVSPYFQMNGDSSVGGSVWADDFSTDDTYNSLIVTGGSISSW